MRARGRYVIHKEYVRWLLTPSNKITDTIEVVKH
ncbi:hypothetical protein BSTP3_098 [Bacillus phage BSTP3]|nr:hypothetical protein BSTP3_098 [Bacillus phage BSTP3]